jgi:dihydrolipoamide dehydrogenase
MVVGETVQEAELVVLGAGPGGYTAALRAAQLGIKTVLIDAKKMPGGVCLHEGCIPSKALLHAAEVVNTAKAAISFGLKFSQPQIDLLQLRTWKEGVTGKLAQGIVGMCKSSQVEYLVGKAVFEDSKTLKVETNEQGSQRLKFKHAIIATGSRPTRLSKLFKKPSDIESPLILDSTSALHIASVPKKFLVVGGGYIGLEMGTVYAALGSQVTVVEMTDGLLPGVDRDLVKPLANHLQTSFSKILLETTVESLEIGADGVACVLKAKDGSQQKENFDSVLIAVGRQPNSDNIGLENTQVEIDNHGFVKIDQYCRTADKRLFAIGDVSGQPMLAHRAMRQGQVVAEVIAGLPSAFDNRAIPAIVFTEPEIAWCGLTEGEAKANGVNIATAKFPWSASGRAMTLADPVGQTKLIYSPDNMRLLGMGIVGPRAGELIAEGVLAIESGAVLEDLAVTIHPHPTLSETIAEASMVAISRAERQRQGQSTKQSSAT